MIPRTIHQIYIKGHLPALYRDWTKKWHALNPEWEHKLWGNELLERYKDDVFVNWMLETNERIAFIVDRLRVLLLRDDGGFYVDTDAYPTRPLRMIDRVWNDERVHFVCGMRNPDRRGVVLNTPGISLVDNTVLASVPGGEMIKRIDKLYRAESRKHTGFSTGKEILRNLDESVVVMGWRYFYAEHDNPNAICLHDSHNSYSWGQPNKEAVPAS